MSMTLRAKLLAAALAWQVSYKTQNFLDKNRDFVVAEHQALMQASSQPFTHLLFPADPDAVRATASPAPEP